jgi:hypothetical protein
LLPEIEHELKNSDVWLSFEEELLEVSDYQAADQPGQPPPPPKAESWDAVEIWFLSDERIEIRNGSSTRTWNYGELGFEDRRSRRYGSSGKPTQAWIMLRLLAKSRGTIRDGSTLGGDWQTVEKRIQEIRKFLREHFRIDVDPLPFVSGTGYQARFKVGCGPSFES